jgi:hypothetical protein
MCDGALTKVAQTRVQLTEVLESDVIESLEQFVKSIEGNFSPLFVGVNVLTTR